MTIFNKATKMVVLGTAAAALLGTSVSIADDSKAITKGEVDTLIKEYILSNPEILIQSLESFEVKQRQQQMEQAQKAVKEKKEDLFADENSPSIGPADADITIVEFFDYNCGYCKKALNDVSQVMKDDKKVRVVFKEFPVLGPNSLELSKWSIAANLQNKDKYFDFHQALLLHKGKKDDDAIAKIAEDVGLNADQLKTEKDSAKVESILKEMNELARALGIRGTPGFVINDELYPGWIPADRMKAEISKKREAMK